MRRLPAAAPRRTSTRWTRAGAGSSAETARGCFLENPAAGGYVTLSREEYNAARVVRHPEIAQLAHGFCNGAVRIRTALPRREHLADAAVAAAWAAYSPEAKRPLKLATPQSAREGWEERRSYQYETSPNERATVFAMAWRSGTQWVVVIVDASDPTFEKRASLRWPWHCATAWVAGRSTGRTDAPLMLRSKELPGAKNVNRPAQ